MHDCRPAQVTCKEPYEWKDGTEEEWEFAKAGEQEQGKVFEGRSPSVVGEGPLLCTDRAWVCSSRLGPAEGSERWHGLCE